MTIAAREVVLCESIQSSIIVFHIVLHAPEIPNNTGTIGRTAVATGCRLHLIRPLGFDLTEKAIRRAGLDYWVDVDLRIHDSWSAFLETESPERLWACTARSAKPIWNAPLNSGDYLLFGAESNGLPERVRTDVVSRWGEEAFVTLPQVEGIRSLNVACAATAIVFEALRQQSLAAE